MNDIITVAQSTFHRVARMGALYFILLICILDVAAMSRYGELSLGMERQLVVDAAQAILLVVALFSAMVAAFEIPRELRDKSATYILSKPSGRTSYVWGKFLGIGMLVVYNVAIVTAGSLLVCHLAFKEVPWALASSAALIAAEGLMLTGVGLVLSTFLSDTASAIALFAVFVLGHAVCMLPRSNAALEPITYILPNFYHLDIKTEVSHMMSVPHAYLGMGLIYGIGYALAMAGVANIVFSRKDLQ